MKKIIALSGVSGSGKTHRRTHDPALKDLPFVDIADIYAGHPGICSARAFVVACNRILDFLDNCDTVIFEAALLPDSRQRPNLAICAENAGAEITYIDIPSPSRIVLLSRIEKDYKEAMSHAIGADEIRVKAYYEARKSFITSTVPQ